MDQTTENFNGSKVDSMKDFEKWRDETALFYNNLCKLYQYAGIAVEKNTELNIIAIPKCLVQLTKEMCRCNLDCVATSFNIKILDTNCLLYNRENIFLSMEHNVCDFLGKKVSNGKLVKNDADIHFDLRNEITTRLEDLCDGKPGALEELQCILYELKEGCKNIEACYEFMLSNKVHRSCKNIDFFYQKNDLEKSLNLSLDKYFNLDYELERRKRSILENAYGIYFNDFNFKQNKEILGKHKYSIDSLESGSSIAIPSCTIPLSILLVFLFGLNYFGHSTAKTKKLIAIFVGASITLLIMFWPDLNIFIE